MGLTIHYNFRFKGGAEDAFSIIKALRERAMDRSFVEISEMRHFVGLHDCDYQTHRHNGDDGKQDDDWVWLLIQAQGESLCIAPDGRQLKKGEHSFVGCCHISPRPTEIIAFRTWAGEGCEEANFGLARYEKTIYYNGKAYTSGQGTGWHWSSFCKTQYANEKGLLNFIRCHTLIIDMLDYAKTLGILKGVNDEGCYWNKRNIDELANEVGRWDELVAGFAGQLKQAFGGDRVVSAIENNPNYEDLKKIGLQHLDKAGVSTLFNRNKASNR